MAEIHISHFHSVGGHWVNSSDANSCQDQFVVKSSQLRHFMPIRKLFRMASSWVENGRFDGVWQRSVFGLAAIILLTGCLSASAQKAPSPKYVQWVKLIKAATNSWKTFDEYTSYADDFARNKRLPEKLPKNFTSPRFLAAVKSARSQVQKLTIPQDPETPPHTLDDVLSGDPTRRRSALAANTKWMTEQQLVAQQRNELVEPLNALRARAKVSLDAGLILEQTYGDLLPIDALDPAKQPMRGKFLDLYVDINPEIRGLIEDIEVKTNQLGRLIAAADSAYDNAGHTLRQLLSQESGELDRELFDIQKERQRLQDSVIEHREKSTELVHQLREVGLELQEFRELSLAASTARRDLNRAERAIESFDQRSKVAFDARNSTAGYGRPYCPQGNSWDNCTNHPEGKAQWKREKLQESEERLRKLKEEYNAAKRDINSLRRDYEIAQKEYDTAAGPTLRRQQEIREQLAQHRKEQPDIVPALKKLAAREKQLQTFKAQSTVDLNKLANIGFRASAAEVRGPSP